MASKVKVDTIEHQGSSGIVISDDIKLSSGKAIKNASGTALLGEDGALGSGVTFPAGHVVKHSIVRHAFAAGSNVNFTIPTTTPALVDWGSSRTLQLTGVTATEGNLLQISTGGFSWYTNDDGTYSTDLTVKIDGTLGKGWGSNQTNNPHVLIPVFFQTYYTVPASFTDKIIEFYANKQTGYPTGPAYFAAQGAYTAAGLEVFVSVLEIQT